MKRRSTHTIHGPVPGKLYRLTGDANTPSIARGDTWQASEVMPRRCAHCLENPAAEDSDTCGPTTCRQVTPATSRAAQRRALQFELAKLKRETAALEGGE